MPNASCAASCRLLLGLYCNLRISYDINQYLAFLLYQGSVGESAARSTHCCLTNRIYIYIYIFLRQTGRHEPDKLTLLLFELFIRALIYYMY